MDVEIICIVVLLNPMYEIFIFKAKSMTIKFKHFNEIIVTEFHISKLQQKHSSYVELSIIRTN